MRMAYAAHIVAGSLDFSSATSRALRRKFGGLMSWLVWLPMLVFEVTLALWFLIKGVWPPTSVRHGSTPPRADV